MRGDSRFSFVWLALFELADFPVMRKCLLGIKRRAEANAAGNLQAAGTTQA